MGTIDIINRVKLESRDFFTSKLHVGNTNVLKYGDLTFDQVSSVILPT